MVLILFSNNNNNNNNNDAGNARHLVRFILLSIILLVA